MTDLDKRNKWLLKSIELKITDQAKETKYCDCTGHKWVVKPTDQNKFNKWLLKTNETNGCPRQTKQKTYNDNIKHMTDLNKTKHMTDLDKTKHMTGQNKWNKWLIKKNETNDCSRQTKQITDPDKTQHMTDLDKTKYVPNLDKTEQMTGQEKRSKWLIKWQ